jgi:hypothetical protein
VRLHGAQGRRHFSLARALFLRGRLAEALSEVLVAKRTFADPNIDVRQARILDHMAERALVLDPTLTTVQGDIARLSR